MDVPTRVASFWDQFRSTRAVDPGSRFYEAFFFSDNQEAADELAQLVLSGRKRATAGLLWTYERERKPLPKAGDFSVVTTFTGEPVAVIETVRVELIPLEDVTEEFAATEGEGDGSLAYWRSEHDAFFARECERIGRAPGPRMPVVCEVFELVYRAGVRTKP